MIRDNTKGSGGGKTRMSSVPVAVGFAATGGDKTDGVTTGWMITTYWRNACNVIELVFIDTTRTGQCRKRKDIWRQKTNHEIKAHRVDEAEGNIS